MPGGMVKPALLTAFTKEVIELRKMQNDAGISTENYYFCTGKPAGFL